MSQYTFSINKEMFGQLRKTISIVIVAAFICTSVNFPAYAQAAQDPMPFMPAPGVMVHLSPGYTPPVLKGIVIHPENALKFDFIVYRGDAVLDDEQKKEEYTKLIKYFFASLAVPNDNQWVNLSPYEKDRIIKDDFGKTEMGRDLLAQDYMLKQITASLIYPQDKLGQEFWKKVYSKAQEEYGTTDIPVNTFNKVWIVPDDAIVCENGNMAYVVKNHLKVMLEEDYLSLAKHTGIQSPKTDKTHTIASQVVREIVLPALQKEVNEGKNFAPLRQVFSGVVLAAWYKQVLKESLLGKIYMNQSRLKGVDQDPRNNEIIYRQYLKAFKKGVFNFIQDDVEKYSNETIPRKYFSGGVLASYNDAAMNVGGFTSDQAMQVAKEDRKSDIVEMNAGIDAAMRTRQHIITIALAAATALGASTSVQAKGGVHTDLTSFIKMTSSVPGYPTGEYKIIFSSSGKSGHVTYYAKIFDRNKQYLGYISIPDPGDHAMKATPLGGIDMNAANLNLQIKRDGNGMPLPTNLQNLENIHIDGLVPEIIDIKPAGTSPIFSQFQLSGAQSNI